MMLYSFGGNQLKCNFAANFRYLSGLIFTNDVSCSYVESSNEIYKHGAHYYRL